jgi:hypothetical protein
MGNLKFVTILFSKTLTHNIPQINTLQIFFFQIFFLILSFSLMQVQRVYKCLLSRCL